MRACQGLGEITVFAPEQNASGTSNALTLNRPLNIFEARGEHVQGHRVVWRFRQPFVERAVVDQRVATVVAGVELLTTGEGDADVVHGDGLAGNGLGAGALFEVDDLQVGGCGTLWRVDERFFHAGTLPVMLDSVPTVADAYTGQTGW